MRTLPFRKVFDRTVRLHGRNPRKDISDDMRDALVEHINARVNTICQGWPWPEWTVTEERAFRQIWRSDTQYLRVGTNGKPDEVFYLGAAFSSSTAFGTSYGYYRVNADAVSDPPIGTAPTDTDFFTPITYLDAYIAYDEVCRRSIGMIRGVYNGNPCMSSCNGNGRLSYCPSEHGIQIRGGGNSTVFIHYSMPSPKYTMLPYVAGKTYTRGDVVFDPATGECFQAVDTTTAAPSDSTHWNWVPFLEKWSGYVCNGAFADSLMESEQGQIDLQTKAALAQAASDRADNYLQNEVDALIAQGQKLTWNRFRHRCGCWYESPLWNGSTVTTLTNACDANVGWVYHPAVDTTGCDTSYHDEIVALLTADGAPSLEGLTTTNRAITCTLITIVIDVGGSPEAQQWRLDAGAADPLDDGQITPADYNVVSNNKHWTKVG